MAMTLRVREELDQQLDQLAARERLSKHQLVIKAVEEYVQRRERVTRTLANAQQIIDENTGLLDRLAE